MNQPTTYEQLIAVKLQELSAPAKIDAIWARIEQQLDVEMPTDESGPTDTGASSNPGFFFPGSKFLYVFLAAVAGLYFLTRPYAIQNEAAEINEQQPYKTTDSASTVSNPIKKSDSEIMFIDKADISVTNEAIPKDSIPDDVVESIPNEVIKKEAEPVVQLPVSIPVDEIKKPLVPIKTDTTSKKKRGVPGINMSDYKIAPVKKDNEP